MDDLTQPDMAVEFKLVYAGQQFPFATVSSRNTLVGFLNNDCTFGVLNNCNWSPLGAGTPIDFSVGMVPLNDGQIATYLAKFGASDGPPIQFPLYGVAIAIPVVNTAITRNGQLILGDGELCGILSGQITDWSQFSYLATPGPFQIVYDSTAGSGSTFLLTQHLNAVCNATNSAFTQLPVPVTDDFSTLPIPGGVAGNPMFLPAGGSLAMRNLLANSTSAIGYIGANFTSVTPKSPATSKLVVAALYNPNDATAYTPIQTAAQLAFNNPGPNAINAQPPGSQTVAADPTRWVPQLPTPGMGYPIVGYANWVLSTCYVTDAQTIIQYLTFPAIPGKHQAIEAQNGFVSLANASAAYNSAVNKVFLSNTSGYNLQIQNPVACGGRVVSGPHGHEHSMTRW